MTLSTTCWTPWTCSVSTGYPVLFGAGMTFVAVLLLERHARHTCVSRSASYLPLGSAALRRPAPGRPQVMPRSFTRHSTRRSHAKVGPGGQIKYTSRALVAYFVHFPNEFRPKPLLPCKKKSQKKSKNKSDFL